MRNQRLHIATISACRTARLRSIRFRPSRGSAAAASTRANGWAGSFSPLAVNKMTSSSMPPNRRDRFGTIAGVNVPSRSRGTSISTFAHICQQLLGPLAIAAVAAVAPGGLVLAVAEVLMHLRLQRRLQEPLRDLP
jgi:hypothetical protein